MEIVYQPVVTLADRKIVGYEALARFDGQSPEQVFMQAWEDGNGLQLEFEAAEHAIDGFDFQAEGSYLAFNLSAKSIVAGLDALMKNHESDVPWSQVCIEITEQQEVKDYLPLYRPLLLLREQKARIAVDDVGKGYSGLWHISQIMPDILKIDHSIVSGLDSSPILKAATRALVQFALEMKLGIVAEGIENESQNAWCKELGVKYGQGYLFGRPEPFPSTP